MNGPPKGLIASIAAIFLIVASFHQPLSAAAAPGAQQAGTTAAAKPAPAARVRLAVNAPSSEVAREIIRVLTAEGYRLVRRKSNALAFQRQADAVMMGQTPASGSGDAATIRVVVKLKENAKGTRIVARMALVTGPGPGHRPKARVTDVEGRPAPRKHAEDRQGRGRIVIGRPPRPGPTPRRWTIPPVRLHARP